MEINQKELNQEEMNQISGAGYTLVNNKGTLSMQVRYMKSRGFSVQGIIQNIEGFAVSAGYLAHKNNAALKELASFIRAIYESDSAGTK